MLNRVFGRGVSAFLPPTRAALRAGGRAQSTADSERKALDVYSSLHLGGRPVAFTTQLDVIDCSRDAAMPIYQVLDHQGRLLDGADDEPQLSEQTVVKMYETMTLLNQMDQIMYDAQRQGRIAFYITNFGEEGAQVGSAAALRADDLVFGQYRESGVLLWRGFDVARFMNQLFGNKLDVGKGKQMPLHYGCPDLHFVTISSTLSTQMPQAVGAAYALRRQGDGRVAVCYLGDGAASEGDAHAAFNFAASLDCPVVFVVRNNGFAISTPTSEQYRGDGIAGRGAGYGLRTIRVDGNDVFAVHKATVRARQLAADNRPVLIEAMTYRLGHHSTSDDSAAYRSVDDLQFWGGFGSPIARLRKYLLLQNWWSEERDSEWLKDARSRVLSALSTAETVKRLPPAEMFTGVYEQMTPELQRQKAQMLDLVERFPDEYPLSKHD